MKRFLTVFVLFTISVFFVRAEELPKPTYDNSLIFSITYNIVVGDPTEVDYIKNQFGNGLYAPLAFSTFQGVAMEWNINPADSGTGIQSFKNHLDAFIAKARQHGVGIHLTLTYGMARNVHYYEDAKIEDIRNAQWYNDNNISSLSQMRGAEQTDVLDLDNVARASASAPSADSSSINTNVFTTPSRYARKLRAHMEAKVAAAFAYLKQVQDANPDVILIISAPGESELNHKRIQDAQYMQDYFCDYSPFAVLEFRDWLKHEGLYADGEKYAGEGYTGGGSRYQGASGLSNFNADFGASYTSWDLKYYNWSLADAVDTVYTDGTNPDTNAIPVSQYAFDGMMPSSGSNYIAGGFDPPRTMQNTGADDFYDLWNTFRETMIYHYVKDMSKIARDSGFTKDRYYTHQIAADYLFGTRPNDPLIPYLNPRYYSSASPLWSADAYSDMGLGITVYDINFESWYARTSKYVVPAADGLNSNWAALEYNSEVHPWSGIPIASATTIYNQFMYVYDYNAHVISLFYWIGNAEWQYKGTNRETGAKQFFDKIKDKARRVFSTVFTPKQVETVSAAYSTTTGLVTLDWSSRIWTDLDFEWIDWGDFKEFVVYRGYSADFTADNAAEIVRSTNSAYIDSTFNRGTTVYYKIAAVNTSGVVGPVRTVSVVVPEGTIEPILSVSRDRLNFGYVMGGDTPPSQTYLVSNNGTGALNWSAVDDAEWLTCTPDSDVLGAVVTASVDPTGLAVGSYSATITVTAAGATNSPQTILVYLTVKSASQNKLPFGEFALPVDNSTVSSSVPVTGWVLDDVGVESVKIYREDGGNMVYIGDALLVEGARPDVEAAYPDYPANYKAGWGYMMLTNFLPNNGNGEFKLYAVATDTFGYEVTLGTKTITCDNANAVKPFGAIDYPAQGGTASGGSYQNHGWALTPMPNSIPTNGSTIDVLINGVNVGHPTYNILRTDVQGLFPTYANSNGAGGRFIFDTTVYPDGIYTIAWNAADFAGNADGIGSRYFSIINSGSSRTSSGTARSSAAARKVAALWQPADLEKLPHSVSTPMSIKTGFARKNEARPFAPGKDGVTHVTIPELGRVVIDLNAPDSTLLSASLRGENDSKPLPIGSTLDTENGVFYWMPCAGFVGDYMFDFVTAEGPAARLKRKQVRVTIAPRHGKTLKR